MYKIKFQYFDKKENIVTDKVLKCIEYDFNIIPSVGDYLWLLEELDGDVHLPLKVIARHFTPDRECRLQNYCTMIVTDADDVPEAHPRGF